MVNYGDFLSNAKVNVPISPSTRVALATENAAKWMHERVVRSINDFEQDLNRDHEVGARLVSFGADVTFHVEDVGFWSPDMIIFRGVDGNGKKVQLLQHITQLSVLLVAVDKTQAEPRRIGFRLMENLEKKAE